MAEEKTVKTNIWTTQRVKEVVDYYNKTGLLPKSHPFLGKDVELREAKLNFSYTQAEILERAKIVQDILYFGNNYAQVMTDSGYRSVKMRNYQTTALLQLSKYYKNIWLASRQCGKCLSFDTDVICYTDDDTQVKMPIFELYYIEFKDLSLWMKLERSILRCIYKLKNSEIKNT